MHIPDAVLDPRVAAATGAIGAAGLAYGLRALETRLGERTTVLMGTMSAFVFAAQMVNFPLGPLAGLGPPAGRGARGGDARPVGRRGGDRGGPDRPVLPLRRRRPDGPGGELRQHGADRLGRRLCDLRADPPGDRRPAGGSDRRDGRGLVLGDAGLGRVRGRAGRLGPPRRLPPRPELDGPGPRGDRAGRGADHRPGPPVHPPDPARPDLRPRGRRRRHGARRGPGWGRSRSPSPAWRSRWRWRSSSPRSPRSTPTAWSSSARRARVPQGRGARAASPRRSPTTSSRVWTRSRCRRRRRRRAWSGRWSSSGSGSALARVFAGRGRGRRLGANRRSPRMRLEFLERYSEGDGPLHRLDARVKLVATLAFVVAVVATPVGWWRLLAAEGLVLAFVIGLSGVPPASCCARWLGFLVLVGFLAADGRPGAPGAGRARRRGRRARRSWPRTAWRSWRCSSWSSVTPFRTLLAAMRRLGMPGDAGGDAPVHVSLPVTSSPTSSTGWSQARRSRTLPPVGPARLGPAHRPDRHPLPPRLRARRAGPRRDARPRLGRDGPDPRRDPVDR